MIGTMLPAGRAERGDEQLHLEALAADHRPALAEIDLQLLARRRLEPDFARACAAS